MHPLEPAKPLNDAQMCGSFYFLMAHYSKTYTSPAQLTALLQSRGLHAEGIVRTMKIQRVHQMMRAINRVRKQAGDTSPKPILMSKEEFFTKVVKTTDNNGRSN